MGRSSSGAKARPWTTGVPKSRKKSTDTCAQRSCSGTSPPVKFTRPFRNAATSWTTSVCWLQKANFAGDPPGFLPCGETTWSHTIRSGSGNGAGVKNTVLTIEKMAVVAPMPSARAPTAASVKPGLRRSERTAYVRSCSSVFMWRML